jgi:hypothetical protein
LTSAVEAMGGSLVSLGVACLSSAMSVDKST